MTVIGMGWPRSGQLFRTPQGRRQPGVSHWHALRHGLSTDVQFCGEHILEDLCLFVAVMHIFDNVNTLLHWISDVDDILVNLHWQLCASMEQPPECIDPVCGEIVNHQRSCHGQDFLVVHHLFGQVSPATVIKEMERQHRRLCWFQQWCHLRGVVKASWDGPQSVLFLANLDVHWMQDNDVLCLALRILIASIHSLILCVQVFTGSMPINRATFLETDVSDQMETPWAFLKSVASLKTSE